MKDEEEVEQVCAGDGADVPQDVEGHAAERAAEEVGEEAGAVIHLVNPQHSTDEHVAGEGADEEMEANWEMPAVFHEKGELRGPQDDLR